MPPITTSKNLGTVSAIWVDNTPPSNIYMMWIDNSSQPYKRKFWDTLTQQWLEVVFVASQANILKRLNTRFGGTTSLTLNDDFYVQNVDGGSQVITLLTPQSGIKGLTYTICNYSDSKHEYTLPVRFNNNDTYTEQPPYTSWQITVAEILPSTFEWVIVNSSVL